MGRVDDDPERRIPLAISQQNIYRGVLQDREPALYLIGRAYRFVPIPDERFRSALEASIRANPVQLCVLDQAGEQYPELVARLGVDDLVRSAADEPDPLIHQWDSGILGCPLVRYTVHRAPNGDVVGLDVHAHHILLDGGATGLIEADLGRFLSEQPGEMPDVTVQLDRLAEAHRRESEKVDAAHQRLTATVQRELAAEVHIGGAAASPAASGQAQRGMLRESVKISGPEYEAITALAEQQQIPLHVLVTAAAVAVDAQRRNSTEALVVHAVDNRFAEPALNVATCLVNSVAQSLRFPAYASAEDLVTAVDRGYVKAVRRRWFREELYRRIYLTIHRAPQTEALALNFLPEPCAPQLRPFLDGPPVTTDIGPIECPTVAAVHDGQQRTLTLSIWDNGLPPRRTAPCGDAARIATALHNVPARWKQPIATSVDGWHELCSDGTDRAADVVPAAATVGWPAWFLDPDVDIGPWRRSRTYLQPWIDWLVRRGVEPGAVLVFVDDHTDKTVDLLIACHLAGCGYSVCDTEDDLAARAEAITAENAVPARVIDVAGAVLGSEPRARDVIDERIRSVATDAELASRIAYVMPTSGSTGKPKLVPISHGALALFSQGHREAYRWQVSDTVLQCAPLTSDISVEEIIGAAGSGAALVRSSAIRARSLPQLAADLRRWRPTILDLPTSIWHLCCEQPEMLDALACSPLRQVVIGGEPVRPSTVAKWHAASGTSDIEVISSYGPTEATVVVTYLPLRCGESGGESRVGRPIAPSTVFVAFGEIVVLGDMVSAGYWGPATGGFGTVTDISGRPRRAFATADRVIRDSAGFLVFAGRTDAVVKLAGKRVDTAAITRLIAEDPEICDVAVEADDTCLRVWFQSKHTGDSVADAAAAQHIQRVLREAKVPGFVVSAVPEIPRKPGGKPDSERLPRTNHHTRATAHGPAAGLAELWSRCLQRDLKPDSSLLAEGVGSLELIRILPATRRYLGSQLSLLDVISADSATRLLEDSDHRAIDDASAAQIDDDLATLAAGQPEPHPQRSPASLPGDTGTVLVLGASGILGTGFAQAVSTLRAHGFDSPVVLATTSSVPDVEPWRALADLDGVRLEHVAAGDVPQLIEATAAATVVNAIGNTNVVVPYRELRAANVAMVADIAAACAAHGAGLVHLSTSVVNAHVDAPQVVDPRAAPYPYAASKSLAELIVAAAAPDLQFTLVRLPRVLGAPHQLRGSADILIALADACAALGAHPAVSLTEEVTTGRSAASSILGELSAPRGRSVTVLRGAPVQYSPFLAHFGPRELDVTEWKQHLDDSNWAQRNPRRWAVIDAWITLGLRLAGRSYAHYLAAHPTIELQVELTREVVAVPSGLADLVARGVCGELTGPR